MKYVTVISKRSPFRFYLRDSCWTIFSREIGTAGVQLLDKPHSATLWSVSFTYGLEGMPVNKMSAFFFIQFQFPITIAWSCLVWIKSHYLGINFIFKSFMHFISFKSIFQFHLNSYECSIWHKLHKSNALLLFRLICHAKIFNMFDIRSLWLFT